MSLILEALRKSEAERRRDNAPDVALELPPAPARAARSTPVWLWPALLGTVALLALGGWLGARMAARDNAAATAALPPTSSKRCFPDQFPSCATRRNTSACRLAHFSQVNCLTRSKPKGTNRSRSLMAARIPSAIESTSNGLK